MPTPSFEQQIRRSIENFVEELSALVRQAAVQSVTVAFGGAASPAASGRRGRRAGTGGGRRALGKGQKRAPGELAKLVNELFAAVKATPGRRMEQIAKDLKSTTRELALPAKKLLADKKIKTKDQRRATRYFPA